MSVAASLAQQYRALNIPASASGGVHQTIIARIVELFPSLEGVRVLDAPSGHGALSELLAMRGAKVIGVDLDPPKSSQCGVDYRAVDMVEFATGLAPESLDLILSVEGVEHLENPTGWIRALAGLLRPGGICILSTPNVDGLVSRFRVLTSGYYASFKPLHGHSHWFRASGHIHPIDFALVHWAARRGGLEVTDLRTNKPRLQWLGKFLFPLLYRKHPQPVRHLVMGSGAVYTLRKVRPAVLGTKESE